MKIRFDPERPIYMQIVEAFKVKISSGELEPGEKVAPVRELASEMGVNPNTLQKALIELERLQLMYTERTSGRYVTNDIAVIDELKKAISMQTVSDFIERMSQLGCTIEDIHKMIDESRC